MGEASPDVLAAVAEALRERSSEQLRRQTAVAMGMLGDPEDVPSLVRAVHDMNYRASSDLLNHLRSIL